MDAKTLHDLIERRGMFAPLEEMDQLGRQQARNAILSALSLAAAVEGPEGSTPETDAAWADDKGHRFQVSASLECRMLAALRALKAERECTYYTFLAFKEERERANKLADLLHVHDRLDAIDAQEGRHD